MLDVLQNTLAVVGSLACSLCFMAVINHFWPAARRRQHNDLIGWQLSVLGTTYAVIIGFMLYTVWTNYGDAEQSVNAEANSLVNLSRLAKGLPPKDGEKLIALARTYGDLVVNSEWKEMDANVIPEQTRDIIREMWSTLVAATPTSASERAAEDHALDELSALTRYRSIRLIETGSHLPGVLWFVLMSGGAITIASTWMFGAASSTLHALQVSAFTLLIVLALAAIADINRPFQGSVHVSDYAFRRAQADMLAEN
jgi:hypothetical protein